MEIWEDRYTNNKGQKESYKVFSMFQVFLQMPKPRSIKKLTSQLYFNNQHTPEVYDSKQFRTKYNSIKKNSHLYKWFERAKEYDKHIIQETDEALIQQFNDFRLQELPNAIQRINGHNMTYQNIKSNDKEMVVTKQGLMERPKRDSDITKSEKENQEAYSLALEDVIKLVTGGVIRTENRNESSVELKSDSPSLFKDKESYHKNVDNDLEDLLD